MERLYLFMVNIKQETEKTAYFPEVHSLHCALAKLQRNVL